MDQYDLVVIGAGQGGDPLARAFAEAGKKVAIIEREHIGGSCTNFGCTPTKILAYSAEVAHAARRAEAYGIKAYFGGVDYACIHRRGEEIVQKFRGGTERKLRDAGVEIVVGEGSFVGPRQVAVGDRRLEGEIVLIDTGTRTAVPPIDGLQEAGYLDNKGLLALEELPEHLIILGGGYIAVEFAQTFVRFGSQVTLIETHDQLLEIEDRDVADCVRETLELEGVEVLLNVETIRVENGPKLHLKDGRTIAGSHLLIATGRKPNTEALNVQNAGVELDERGYVRVDERLRTTAEGVYALGDVKGGPAFTHLSYDDYRILKANLMDGGELTIEGRQTPWCVYTDPQVGRFGLGEEQAQEKGIPHRVAKLPLTDIARAIECDRTRGFLKVLVAQDSDAILGIAAVMPEGGEIASLIQVAMAGGLTYRQLEDMILIHPSWAEAFNTLFRTLK